jgi:hypothetical protein
MIAAELIFELQKVHDHFDWKFVLDGPGSEDRRGRNRLRLRGVCKNGSGGLMFEPIGAVCYMQTGRTYTNDSWMEAANILGLSLMDAADLTAAANDVTWQKERVAREPDRYIQSLRNRLIAAVGLEVGTPVRLS